ncbi:MAG TPA: hypothetical protein VFE78_06795 [Gemmataceae bacterium]|jgi:uncharacterized protein (UPF0332 family)|nr:hypothetical protein [Gemmataceae bacterium]
MGGREFLQSARHLLADPSEANWRSATGRAYYALLHEGRAVLDRWGFPLPPRESIHAFVRRHFAYPVHPDLGQVDNAFDDLSRWRNQADYHLGTLGLFASAALAHQAVALARSRIDLLDQIDGDPARRAAAVAAVRQAFP